MPPIFRTQYLELVVASVAVVAIANDIRQGVVAPTGFVIVTTTIIDMLNTNEGRHHHRAPHNCPPPLTDLCGISQSAVCQLIFLVATFTFIVKKHTNLYILMAYVVCIEGTHY